MRNRFITTMGLKDRRIQQDLCLESGCSRKTSSVTMSVPHFAVERKYDGVRTLSGSELWFTNSNQAFRGQVLVQLIRIPVQ